MEQQNLAIDFYKTLGETPRDKGQAPRDKGQAPRDKGQAPRTRDRLLEQEGKL